MMYGLAIETIAIKIIVGNIRCLLLIVNSLAGIVQSRKIPGSATLYSDQSLG